MLRARGERSADDIAAQSRNEIRRMRRQRARANADAENRTVP